MFLSCFSLAYVRSMGMLGMLRQSERLLHLHDRHGNGTSHSTGSGHCCSTSPSSWRTILGVVHSLDTPGIELGFYCRSTKGAPKKADEEPPKT